MSLETQVHGLELQLKPPRTEPSQDSYFKAVQLPQGRRTEVRSDHEVYDCELLNLFAAYCKLQGIPLSTVEKEKFAKAARDLWHNDIAVYDSKNTATFGCRRQGKNYIFVYRNNFCNESLDGTIAFEEHLRSHFKS